MSSTKKIIINGEQYDISVNASNVDVKDENFNYQGFNLEEILQEVSENSASFDSRITEIDNGWEVASLLEGDNWSANKTEFLRAYATGKPIYIPPGTYEIDDVLMDMTAGSERDFIIWSNNVTFKRPDDPLIPARDTDCMFRINGSAKLSAFKWYGKTIFDGNEGNAYEVPIGDTSGWGNVQRTLIFIGADSAPTTLGVFYIEDHDYRNHYGSPFFCNGASSTPRFEYAKIGRIHQRNCGLSTWRFRVRIKNGFVEAGDLSTEETGGDKGLRWSVTDTQGEYPGGGFSFELGETAIQSTHTQLLKIDSYTQRYPKYGGINWLGVKNVIMGDYFIYNAFRNDDDTLATMSGSLTTRKVMKIGSYVWNKNMSQTYSVDIGKLVMRNQANAVSGGLPTNVEATLEIDDSSPLFNIGWLEADSDVQLGRPSSATELISEPLRINTFVWHGSNGFGELDFNSNIVVDNLIITDRFEDSSISQSRNKNIYISDTVKINSVTRENGAGCTWWMSSSSARNEDGEWGWNSRSNIEINNGDLNAVYMNLNFGTTGGDSAWRPADANYSASVGATYLKAKFTNCKIANWRNYVIKDAGIITLGEGGLSDGRDRIQLEFINCKIKENGNGDKALLLDPTTGIRATGTSGLVPVPGESAMVDNFGGDPVVIPGTNDLPDGEYIGPSKLINTTFALFDEEIDEGEIVTGWGEGQLIDSGNYFVDDTVENALQELGQKESLVQVTTQPEYDTLSAGDKALSISYIRRSIQLIYPLNTLTGLENAGVAPTLAALPGTPPAEIAGFTNGILFDTTGGTDTYTRIVLPSGLDEMYVQMYVYFNAYLDPNNGAFDWVLGVGNSAETSVVGYSDTSQAVCIRYQSASFPDMQYYTQPGSNANVTFPSNVAPSFNTGQWFKVGMHLIRNGTVTYYLDGESGNITRTASDFAMDYVRIGRYTTTGTQVTVSGLTVGETGFINL